MHLGTEYVSKICTTHGSYWGIGKSTNPIMILHTSHGGSVGVRILTIFSFCAMKSDLHRIILDWVGGSSVGDNV